MLRIVTNVEMCQATMKVMVIKQNSLLTHSCVVDRNYFDRGDIIKEMCEQKFNIGYWV